MDAERIAWDIPLPSPSRPSPVLRFLPPLPSPHHLSPRHILRSVFVPSLCCPASIVSLLFLLCCLFCFALFALLGARVGLLCASSPSLPPFSFLCSACLLCAPLAYCLCLFFPLVSSVAGCPCSLPRSLTLLVCVRVCPELRHFKSHSIWNFSTNPPYFDKCVMCSNKLQDFLGLLASIDANLLTQRLTQIRHWEVAERVSPSISFERSIAICCQILPPKGPVCVSCFNKQAVTGQLLTRDMQDRALWCCWFGLYVKKNPAIHGNWAKPQTQHAESCPFRMQ